MRQLLPGRVGIGLQESHGRHDEARHAEGALKSLFVNDSLLYRVQRSIGAASPSMVVTFRLRTVWVRTEHE